MMQAKAKTNSGPFKDVVDAVRREQEFWMLTLETEELVQRFPKLKNVGGLSECWRNFKRRVFPEVKENLRQRGIMVKDVADLKQKLSDESRQFRELQRQALDTIKSLPANTNNMLQSTSNKWAEEVRSASNKWAEESGKAAVKAHSQIASQAQAVVDILNSPAPESAFSKFSPVSSVETAPLVVEDGMKSPDARHRTEEELGYSTPGSDGGLVDHSTTPPSPRLIALLESMNVAATAENIHKFRALAATMDGTTQDAPSITNPTTAVSAMSDEKMPPVQDPRQVALPSSPDGLESSLESSLEGMILLDDHDDDDVMTDAPTTAAATTTTSIAACPAPTQAMSEKRLALKARIAAKKARGPMPMKKK